MAVPAQPQRTPVGAEISGRWWGITKNQVRALVAECRKDPAWDSDDNVRAFVDKFVLPRTRGLGMGLSLAMNQQAPKEVTLMISHAWDENADRFFDDLEAHVREDEVMFICFLALYQCGDGAGPTICEQLGDDVYAGPFAEVIENLRAKGPLADLSGGLLGRARGRMLVVTCLECALYSRLWCVWEVYIALTRGVPISFAGPGRLFATLTASSKDARCGNPALPMNEDERKIRQAIESIRVETCRSQLGGVAAVVVILAAVLVPLGISAGWAMGLAIAAGVVATSSRILALIADFFPVFGATLPQTMLMRGVAWVVQCVGNGLYIGAAVCMFLLVVGGIVCRCLISRRRIRSGARFTANLADPRHGYARLDAVVRRAARES